MKDEFIPLLSGRPLDGFTPEEFKKHVRSLYFKEPPRPSKKKAPTSEVTWGRTKKGSLTVRVNRTPKWITEDEMTLIAAQSETPLNELFIYLKRREIKIKPCSG